MNNVNGGIWRVVAIFKPLCRAGIRVLSWRRPQGMKLGGNMGFFPRQGADQPGRNFLPGFLPLSIHLTGAAACVTVPMRTPTKLLYIARR